MSLIIAALCWPASLLSLVASRLLGSVALLRFEPLPDTL